MTEKGIKKFTCILLYCCFNSNLCLSQTIDNDTTSLSATLQEVVVRAPEAVQSGNKHVFYPSKGLKESMSTASLLLAGLQIPELIVNPATGNIAVADGCKLIIRVNGRPVSLTYLFSISSKDIIKVEYISNPGSRYGSNVRVLELTIRSKEEGYGVVLNLLQSPNRGWGDYTASLKYGIGRSEWSADYHSNPMWNMDCYRDNIENINLPDGSKIVRDEQGLKTPNRMVTHRAAIQYSYANKTSFLLNIQGRIVRQNDRYVSVGKIFTDYKSQSSYQLEKEIAPFSLWQSDLDIYLHWKINPRHKIFFNIVPTKIVSKSERIYETEDLSIISFIDNHGYILLSEGVWEGRISNGLMTGGFREEFQYNKAVYFPAEKSIRNRTFESHCFIEWSHNLGKFKYLVGMDGSLFQMESQASKSFVNISPKLFINYTPFTGIGINLSANGASVYPTPLQLSPVEQRVDLFQYSKGSPTLSPYIRYNIELGTDFKVKDSMMKLSIADNYSHKPIMGAKIYDNNRIMQEFFNSGYHNDLIIKGQIRTPFIIKKLTLSLEGGWHRMVSKGMNYQHKYSQCFVNAQIMFITGHWWFMAKYNNAYNVLWGEMISTVNNNLLNLGMGYRYKSAVLMVGIVNPIGNVSIKSRDLSQLAGYERTYYAASTNCLVWIGMTLNIYKGKSCAATQKKLENIKTYQTIKNVQK